MNIQVLGLGLLGLALPVLALGGLLFRSPRVVRWLRLSPFVLAAAGAALAWAVGLWLAPLVLAALAGLFLAAGSPAGGRLLDRGLEVLRANRVQWSALLVAGPALAVAWVCREQASQPPAWEGPPPDILAAHTPSNLRPVKAAQALTDAGRPVALYQVTAHPPVRELRQYEQRLIKNLAGDVIATRPTGLDSNCHGWVFTGGRFWVQGDAVDRIVQENGYREAKQPRAGDLVVYREGDGKVIHTGVVRYVDEEGQALVESKWGVASRFLHPADRHCYPGANPVFYRSARTGHLLRGLSSPEQSAPEPTTTAARDRASDPGPEAVALAAAEAHGSSDEADTD
jgi:hypothetical protein